VPGDFPAKKDIFDSGPLSDIVFDHITTTRAFAVNDNSYVWHVAPKIVSYEVSWAIVFGSSADGQGFTLAPEKYHQIRNAAVIDIAIGFPQTPLLLSWVCREILHHILMHLLLQIDAQRPIRTDHLVSTNARVRWNIAPWIRDAHIRRVVAYIVIRPLGGSANQAPKKILPRLLAIGMDGRGETAARDNDTE
jgi:hypothetical protein